MSGKIKRKTNFKLFPMPWPEQKDSADLNQAMMELGATVCTPKKVMCLLCPWNKTCVSYASDTISQRPLLNQKLNLKSGAGTLKSIPRNLRSS